MIYKSEWTVNFYSELTGANEVMKRWITKIQNSKFVNSKFKTEYADQMAKLKALTHIKIAKSQKKNKKKTNE